MSNEAVLDKLIKDCQSELDKLISVGERLRSGQLRLTNVSEDIDRCETRATNLRKTIRQLRAHKIVVR